MARPVTLFTGQWADLPLADLAAKAAAWGFDGLELACWGDHFEVDKALSDPAYVDSRRELLERNGLRVFAVGAHLVGQCVCDPIDERHRAIVPPEVWGDGEPEGVRRRAAERMKDTARAAAASDSRCIRRRSPTTSSLRARRWPRSITVRSSGSTSIRATSRTSSST